MDLKKFLKNLRLHESTISMILGVLIVLVIGYLGVNYIRQQDSTNQNSPVIGNEEAEIKEQQTHTVQENETLWTISEKYYGTGFNWTKIRDANNITDPNQIEKGQSLAIPSLGSSNQLASGVSDTKEADSKSDTQEEETPQTTDESKASEKKHVVALGDSLWLLAEQYYNDGFEWKKIADDNGIENASNIEVGQELRIVGVETKVASASSTEPNNNNVNKDETYTVQKGDSLWAIAAETLGDGNRWVDIAKENNLVKPGVIHIGNTLKLPKTS